MRCLLVIKNYCINRDDVFWNTMTTHKIQPAHVDDRRIIPGSPESRARRIRHLINLITLIAVIVLLLAWPPAASAQITITLDAIDFSILSGNRVQIELRLSDPVEKPQSFATYNPARIALDFPGVKLNLPQKSQTINYALILSIMAAETPERARVVINLIRPVPYKMDIINGTILITIGASGDAKYTPGETELHRIEDIVFERGNAGDGLIHVKLSDPFIVIDTHEKGDNIIVVFFNTELPKNLNRILDVIDFATPILTIDTFAQGNDTRMIIKTTGNYEHLVYQTHKQGSIELRPIQ